ncbi:MULTISPECIES: hypothetical protein [Cyanophyceae]|uniref:Uncharacterized protein n=1 Tax=Nodularia spumigena CENA596 TaxID=1819295 RepID=A0A166INX1_NODSP|nr:MULTISPECIES: hypothetical protein [Cyanophyceae]MDB9357608.1 hypothetical protein [Nodularia spumigena CS-587/03]KZL48646.1 hypothetical protein A2T98_16895 [Nodularia spumigena CENA596]MDB9306953.1 hypothetical protein [Nodularia spumigena CS-591/12]MDB9316243.1 hypothetical protein [Nodularia spumigena CS-590/01A]MDB9321580.1 hypothetical protein [Nodularia spumigena CS-591/07A]
MNHWLGIALVAYLIGAAIEGVSTVSQLSRLVQELAQGTQDQSSASDTPPNSNWQILTTIASVSICGAFCWPCRLLHRSIKGCISSRNL